MKRSNGMALGIGASSGLILALALMLYASATGGIPSVGATLDSTGIVPVFTPAASALWIAVILAASFGGFVLAAATRAVTRVIDPEATSAAFALVAVVGMVVAPVVAMAAFPLGTIVFGSIDNGTVSLGVAEMVWLTAAVGILAGAMVVWLAYILARPPVEEADLGLLSDTADRSA